MPRENTRGQIHWAISIVSIATLSKRGSFRPGATGVTNIVLGSLGVLTRRCLRKAAHSEPAVTMLPTRKRAEDDHHWPFASLRCDATIPPELTRRQRPRNVENLSRQFSRTQCRRARARALGMLLWGVHSVWRISQKHHAIVNYFFFPVTSSHFSPRSVLILSTFTQASSFIWTNNARAAA
jgi:hypothetical protein